MGFRDLDEFERLYQQEAEEEVTKGKAFKPKEDSLIDGMTVLLNNIFSENGEQIAHSFIYFMYDNKTQLTIQMDDKLMAAMKTMTDKCQEECLDINSVLRELILKFADE